MTSGQRVRRVWHSRAAWICFVGVLAVAAAMTAWVAPPEPSTPLNAEEGPAPAIEGAQPHRPTPRGGRAAPSGTAAADGNWIQTLRSFARGGTPDSLFRLLDRATRDPAVLASMVEYLRTTAEGEELNLLMNLLANIEPDPIPEVIADALRRVTSLEDVCLLAGWAGDTSCAAAVPAIGERLAALLSSSTDADTNSDAILRLVDAVCSFEGPEPERVLRETVLQPGVAPRYTSWAAAKLWSVGERTTLEALGRAWLDSLVVGDDGRMTYGDQSDRFPVALGRATDPRDVRQTITSLWKACARPGERAALLMGLSAVAHKQGTAESVIDVLLEGLRSEDQVERLQASMALGNLPDTGDAPVAAALATAIANAQNEMDRASAMAALSRVAPGDVTVFEGVVARFRAADRPEFRLWLAMHLARYRDRLLADGALLDGVAATVAESVRAPTPMRVQGAADAIMNLRAVNEPLARALARQTERAAPQFPGSRDAVVAMWASFLPDTEAADAIGRVAIDPRMPVTTRREAVRRLQAHAARDPIPGYLRTLAREADHPLLLDSVGAALRQLPADHAVVRELRLELDGWPPERQQALASALRRE